MQKQNRYHTNYQEVFKDLPEDRKQQALELAKLIAEGRQDPVLFGEKLLGLKFHAKQKIWLWLTTQTQIDRAYELAQIIGYKLPPIDSIKTHNFLKNILCPSNRFGKTFVTAVKHCWYNFYKIGMTGDPKNIALAPYSTLNLSPHSMQVDALYAYIVSFFQETFVYEWPMNSGIKVRNVCRIKEFMIDKIQVRREILFANNSKVKGAPTGDDQASSIQGTNYFYISYDEAPQSIHLRAELPAKILSRLIDSGGPLDLIGTPEVDKASHQYYSRIVKHGLTLKEGWFTLLGSLDENEFIPTAQKEKSLEAIKSTDPEKYRQVRFGEFVSTGGKLFPPVVIEKLWEGQYPESPKDGHKYLEVVDWGFSDDGDPTVIYIFDYTELVLTQDEFLTMFGTGRNPKARVVFRERIKGGSPYEALARVRILQEEYNDAEFLHDSTSMGGVMLKKMLRELHVRHIHDFVMDSGSKEEMLFLSARALSYGRKTERDDQGRVVEKVQDFGKIRSFVIPELEEQLGTYKLDDKKLEQDEVMAFCMGVWFIEKKLVKDRIPVYDFNILASKPEDIIRVSKNIPNRPEIKTRVINLKEKRIG